MLIPNEDGSTVTWTFIKPDGLSEDEFKKQLANFHTEIMQCSALENNKK